MQVPDVISSSYAALTVLAFVVVWFYRGPVIHAVRTAKLDTPTTLSIGIFLAWFAEGSTRAWWAIWRWGLDRGHDVGWMVTHPFVALFSLLLIIAALMHVRAATKSRRGEAAWLFVAGVAALAAAADWLSA